MFRPRTILWLLGLALLVGTAAGAGWILNHGESSGQATTTPSPSGAADGIFAIGHVDVQPKVADLYPLQSGRVTWVEEEGKQVKKGDVLLKLDDRIPRAKLQQAEADLEAAKKQLEKAKLAAGQHEEKLKQLQAAVAAAEGDKATAEQVQALKGRAAKNSVGPTEEYEAAKGAVKKAEAQLAAAQSKLRQAKAFMVPLDKLEEARAAADVAAKQALVEEARLAVSECQVVAPEDGEVMRVLTGLGETLGGIPRTAAIQFAPKARRIIRAEIQQEFAGKVRVGQEAVIIDDTTTAYQWRGRIKHLSDWYTNRRSVIQEPFQLNDVRTLECLVEIIGPEQQPLRIGQRVRVRIPQGGP
jgi:multidrug resistance efflux pump